MAYDYGVINLECYGAPDLLVSYQGLECGPDQQDYCAYKDGLESEEDTDAETDGGESTDSGEENTVEPPPIIPEEDTDNSGGDTDGDSEIDKGCPVVNNETETDNGSEPDHGGL